MQIFKVEVWGDLACFTRPETKVERFSYPVMTPSAARGVLDAIYAKPTEFGWRIRRIEVLRPIRFIALRRNEVKEKISVAAIGSAMKGKGDAPLILCDATDALTGTDMRGRTQRQTIALRDVRYRIHAHIQPRLGYERHQVALEAQAQRRIAGGKCFYQPYLGCREFVAHFAPADDLPAPVAGDMEIGWMLYDVFDLDSVVIDTAEPFVTLFRAELIQGVLNVPDWGDAAVRKPGQTHGGFNAA
jgi:CRISPR-associated protein Cas5d